MKKLDIETIENELKSLLNHSSYTLSHLKCSFTSFLPKIYVIFSKKVY